MSAFRTRLVPAVLLCVSMSCHFATAATGGVVNFEGAVVEPPCNINIDTRHATLACERQGYVKTQNFTLKSLVHEKSAYNNLVMVKINYLNPEHTHAVVDLTYN